ncbi:MAG TPA: signal peptidase II [Candidatus Hydrogenedentes bacterium]|nr:signal peptidase II [Candidatus Hydrogenedentota bacterium]
MTSADRKHTPTEDKLQGSAVPEESFFLLISRRSPRRKIRIGLVLIICVFLIAADHATKWWAVAYLKGAPAWHAPGDLVRIVYAENTGAFLSLGGQLPKPWRLGIMIGLNSIILTGLTAWLIFRREIAVWPLVALSLVLSGGLGNLLDRLFRPGHVVVDFMNIGITTSSFSLRTGIFNIADLAIMGGLFMIVAWELFLAPRNPETQEA